MMFAFDGVKENALARKTVDQPYWWGKYTLEVGQCLQINIGKTSHAVLRQAREWQLHYNNVTDTNENDDTWQVSIRDGIGEDYEVMERYVFHQTGASLNILPLQADRPVVTRPLSPLHLPSGEEITLYVSSPLWLQVVPAEVPVREVPIYRPSDTWFGPSTMKGELCYASVTHGRTELADVPQRPHRAITPVLIRNQADSAMVLERLNLPVPYLSLYADDNGQLWTEAVTMARSSEKDTATVEIGKAAPPEARGASRVTSPRESESRNIFTSTFSTLFG